MSLRYEEAKEVEARFDARVLAAAVAGELGPEWRPVDPFSERSNAEPEEREKWARGRHQISREDGAAVYFSLHTYPNAHLTWHGVFPLVPGKGPNEDFGPSSSIRVTIRTSTARPAKALAADVKRRLLPTYLEQYAAVCVRRDETAKATDASAELCAHLERILGLKHRDMTRHNGHRAPGDDYVIDLGSILGDHGYGDLTVSAGGSVRIELRALNARRAQAIARAIKACAEPLT